MDTSVSGAAAARRSFGSPRPWMPCGDPPSAACCARLPPPAPPLSGAWDLDPNPLKESDDARAPCCDASRDAAAAPMALPPAVAATLAKSSDAELAPPMVRSRLAGSLGCARVSCGAFPGISGSSDGSGDTLRLGRPVDDRREPHSAGAEEVPDVDDSRAPSAPVSGPGPARHMGSGAVPAGGAGAPGLGPGLGLGSAVQGGMRSQRGAESCRPDSGTTDPALAWRDHTPVADPNPDPSGALPPLLPRGGNQPGAPSNPLKGFGTASCAGAGSARAGPPPCGPLSLAGPPAASLLALAPLEPLGVPWPSPGRPLGGSARACLAALPVSGTVPEVKSASSTAVDTQSRVDKHTTIQHGKHELPMLPQVLFMMRLKRNCVHKAVLSYGTAAGHMTVGAGASCSQ